MKPPFAFDHTAAVIGGFAHGAAGSRQGTDSAVSTKGSLLKLQEHIPVIP